MSAYGYKRTLGHPVIYVRSTPESGHSEGSRGMSAFDPKETFGSQENFVSFPIDPRGDMHHG